MKNIIGIFFQIENEFYRGFVTERFAGPFGLLWGKKGQIQFFRIARQHRIIYYEFFWG